MSPLPRLVLVAVLFASAVPKTALAQGPDGTVIALDNGDLVVDVGSTKGLREGDIVELWRPVRLRHPATGQMLVDRFRIGSLRLTQVRKELSLAALEGSASRAPAAGDVILLASRAPEKTVMPATAETPTTTSTPPNAPPLDRDGQDLGELMSVLAGSDPAMRAQAYDTFVRAHPKSRFVRVLREEAIGLRAAHPAERTTYDSSSPKIDRVRAGEPQRFAVELDPAFVGAVVHVRRKGAPGYRSLPMESIGPRYWAATLPGDAMTDEGMEYFVEGVPKETPAVAVIGTAETPRVAEVDAAPTTPRPPGTLAQVALQSEFASFNVKKPNDYVWQTEGTVGWRLRDEGIRAVRSGFGVLRGSGGSLHDLDDLGKDPETIGLTYGYIEAEVTLTPKYSLIGRPILGLREQGITGGAQGFVRIGNDLRTNLSIGGEVLGGVGQRGIVSLEWRTIPRVPILLRTEVTSQPANAHDVGARAIAQVGYQLTKELVVAGRGSYQGRTINHAGPGAGLAVSYQW